MLYTERTIFQKFREKHSDLWRHGSSYSLAGCGTIEILIPRVGKLKYNAYMDRIEWINRWGDTPVTKERELEIRSQMYSRFCVAIKCYMKDQHMSQEDISEIVGVS